MAGFSTHKSCRDNYQFYSNLQPNCYKRLQFTISRRHPYVYLRLALRLLPVRMLLTAALARPVTVRPRLLTPQIPFVTMLPVVFVTVRVASPAAFKTWLTGLQTQPKTPVVRRAPPRVLRLARRLLRSLRDLRSLRAARRSLRDADARRVLLRLAILLVLVKKLRGECVVP